MLEYYIREHNYTIMQCLGSYHNLPLIVALVAILGQGKQNLVYLHGTVIYSRDRSFEHHGLMKHKTVEPKSWLLK